MTQSLPDIRRQAVAYLEDNGIELFCDHTDPLEVAKQFGFRAAIATLELSDPDSEPQNEV